MAFLSVSFSGLLISCYLGLTEEIASPGANQESDNDTCHDVLSFEDHFTIGWGVSPLKTIVSYHDNPINRTGTLKIGLNISRSLFTFLNFGSLKVVVT